MQETPEGLFLQISSFSILILTVKIKLLQI